MGLFDNEPKVFGQRDPEKRRQKEEARAAKDAQRAEEDYLRSPAGRARAARDAGDRFFQISLPITETERTWISALSGDVSTKSRGGASGMHLLEQIEQEGWRLENVGYVFEETGSISRDKFLSSGQVEQVTGRIVAIYLFRAVE